ncbi:hypothetical protein DFJ74DRAFT_758600 [Hyaloraphidium curvatum]|nr:hypothetical protein DFJ74DRAFT_758600 [Hyaloraphidium curvatum]
MCYVHGLCGQRVTSNDRARIRGRKRSRMGEGCRVGWGSSPESGLPPAGVGLAVARDELVARGADVGGGEVGFRCGLWVPQAQLADQQRKLVAPSGQPTSAVRMHASAASKHSFATVSVASLSLVALNPPFSSSAAFFPKALLISAASAASAAALLAGASTSAADAMRCARCRRSRRYAASKVLGLRLRAPSEAVRRGAAVSAATRGATADAAMCGKKGEGSEACEACGSCSPSSCLVIVLSGSSANARAASASAASKFESNEGASPKEEATSDTAGLGSGSRRRAPAGPGGPGGLDGGLRGGSLDSAVGCAAWRDAESGGVACSGREAAAHAVCGLDRTKRTQPATHASASAGDAGGPRGAAASAAMRLSDMRAAVVGCSVVDLPAPPHDQRAYPSRVGGPSVAHSPLSMRAWTRRPPRQGGRVRTGERGLLAGRPSCGLGISLWTAVGSGRRGSRAARDGAWWPVLTHDPGTGAAARPRAVQMLRLCPRAVRASRTVLSRLPAAPHAAFCRRSFCAPTRAQPRRNMASSAGPSPLRLLYWCAASAASAVTLYQLHAASAAGLPAALGAAWPSAWFAFRTVLAYGQLPIHLGLLMYYRTHEVTPSTPPALGKLLSPGSFYAMVKACNAHLLLVIAAGLWAHGRLASLSGKLSGAQAEALETAKKCEAAVVAIWAAVLLARVYAGATGQTREWFFLRWSPEVAARGRK